MDDNSISEHGEGLKCMVAEGSGAPHSGSAMYKQRQKVRQLKHLDYKQTQSMRDVVGARGQTPTESWRIYAKNVRKRMKRGQLMMRMEGEGLQTCINS